MSGKTEYPPTVEQQVALDLFATGRSLAIEAGAGAGKTSTLQLLAESTSKRVQYIAFNKAIVVEAGGKMPRNVTASTAHSLAFRNVVAGTRFAERLRASRRMKSSEIATRLGINEAIRLTLPDGTTKKLSRGLLAGIAMRGLVRFCQSADAEPEARHVPYIDGIDLPPGARVNNAEVARILVQPMRKAWADAVSPEGTLPFKHDYYLKMWQLSGPRINAEVIMFDEAQDANPVLVAIVAAQTHAQLVWVGDSQQQIYTFTGAVNALQAVGAEQEAFLTQSFRFGPAVAEVANRVLGMLDAPLRLSGTESIPSEVGPISEPDVVLSRTNAAAVRGVLDTISEGRRPHLVGGGKDVVEFARAAARLMSEGWTEHPELSCFDSWAEVQNYVQQDEQGGDLRLLVSLIDDFGVETIIEALDRMPREEDADVIFSTAHKSKGREWDSVQLASDFPADPHGEELRLLYVAATRARLRLDISAIAVLSDGVPPAPVVETGTVEVEAATPEQGSESVSGVIPEAAQIALGELGEALMKDGDAKDWHIERAIELLRSLGDATEEGPAAPSASLAEDLAGREGSFAVYVNGSLGGILSNSRKAIESASEIYGATGQRVTVLDERSGELVVEYDR